MLTRAHGLLLLLVGGIGGERVEQNEMQHQLEHSGLAPLQSSLAEESRALTGPPKPKPILSLMKQGYRWTYTKWLGGGSFGDISLMHLRCPMGEHTVEDLPVARKSQFYGNSAERDMIVNEAKIMRDEFNSKAFPQYFSTLEESNMDKEGQPTGKGKIYVDMEVAGGTLKNVIKGPKANQYQLPDKASLFADAMYGVQEINRLGYIHRDLKPENVFLSADLKHALVGDFGLAKEAVPTAIKETPDPVGTYTHMAPEVHKNHEYNAKQDVWAMGVIFYQMIHKKPPEGIMEAFAIGRQDMGKLYNMDITKDAGYEFVPMWVEEQNVPDSTDKAKLARDVQDLLKGMLQVNPNGRMDAAEAFEKAVEISKDLGNPGDVEKKLLDREVTGHQYCDFKFSDCKF
mmetsp:Transcript_107675/g.213969  ORF Transcript_107675/g.213969 Transcript_107675/m.213969 type:complete len:400 (-) Transcript_107675:2-1201(-)